MAQSNTKSAAKNGYLLEKVPFRAFKDGGKYKDDITVIVNGKPWKVKRGETVMLPRYVVMELERSMRQDEHTADMVNQMVEEYEARAAALN